MKLYNYKFSKLFIVGSVISLIISTVIILSSINGLDISLIALNIFLFLWAITKEKDENEIIKEHRYKTLLMVFTITFATFISFSIVSSLVDDISIDSHIFLSLSLILLTFYHIIYRLKLSFSARVDKIRSNITIRVLYGFLLLSTLTLSVFLYFK